MTTGLDAELKSSEETALEVKRILNKDKTLDIERNTTVVAFIDQALEHHAAILLLLRSRLVGSAFALTRSVTEILYRGVWFTVCASDEQVKRFVKDDKIDLTVAEMTDAIDATCGLEYFAEFKKQTWKVLNSYAHTGMLQHGRRFDGGKLAPSYTDAEQIEVLRVITSCILMLVRPFLANQGLDSAKEIDKLMIESFKSEGNMLKEPGELPEEIRTAPRDLTQHWSILDQTKAEMKRAGRPGVVLIDKEDANYKVKMAEFLAKFNHKWDAKKPYLVIQHDTESKALFDAAVAAGLDAELI